MKLKHLLGSAILVLTIASTVFGAIRPSFRLDHSARKATHIVIAVTTAADRTFEVVESLKGDLHVGARLVIPDLRPSNEAEPTSSRLYWICCSTAAMPVPSCANHRWMEA